ncbi:hypothetical protein BRW65_12575 [Mycobacterium paraffinicum]|uniref:Uncharacterized protein n=1 Tax=Mycobacterium paraffinicum TaxID=53378 RepID=A0A1Q4HUW9_9MYCO|nr:hypothetical protein [Mycobacterium paraffinicum]OJZ73471.1 hypothetical protein BRW65_12575 [Mycobacterium paraffinicum]
MAVAEWKLKGSYWPMHRKTLDRNLDDDIRDIARTALTAPLTIQHRVMGLLYGVAVPVASALLMVWNDKRHTVIDRRAVNSFVEQRMIPKPPVGKLPPYLDYLDVCQRVSQRCGYDLRELDRALYKANGNRGLPPHARAHA